MYKPLRRRNCRKEKPTDIRARAHRQGGLEALYEEQLRARDGIKIYIIDQYGKEKEVLASSTAQDGKDIVCTIDANVQSTLYAQFCGIKAVPSP
jgi:cell division protein FtsI/penicillin-binding protein 2